MWKVRTASSLDIFVSCSVFHVDYITKDNLTPRCLLDAGHFVYSPVNDTYHCEFTSKYGLNVIYSKLFVIGLSPYLWSWLFNGRDR